MNEKETTLYLVDLSIQSASKLRALAEQAEGTNVLVCQGQIGNLSVNTGLSDERLNEVKSILPFEFISFKEIRKRFLEFEHKFVVAGDDIFTTTLIDELNLSGRKDVGVLNFSPDRTPEQAYEMSKTAFQMCQQVVAEMSNVKLQFAALLSVLSEEQRTQYNETISKTKSAVQQTLSLQKEFITFLASIKKTSTIQSAVSQFCEEKGIQKILISVLQNYEKMSGISSQDFDAHINARVAAQDLVKNEILIHAFLAACTSLYTTDIQEQPKE